MYAIIKTGGKQYKVAPGDVLEVEHLKGESAHFQPLLVVTDEGRTLMGGTELGDFPVEAKVLGDAKGDKVQVFKYRPKSGYASRNGHRQLYSLIQITAIGEVKATELLTHEQVQPERTGQQKPAPAPADEADEETADEAVDAADAQGDASPAAEAAEPAAVVEQETATPAAQSTSAAEVQNAAADDAPPPPEVQNAAADDAPPPTEGSEDSGTPPGPSRSDAG